MLTKKHSNKNNKNSKKQKVKAKILKRETRFSEFKVFLPKNHEKK